MNPANSGSGKPLPSFQTNVNRSKTKRWVEAKSYSYDGDDWGDDEYDEYDTSPPPPQPPFPAVRATGLRKPSVGVTSPTSEPSSGRLPSSSSPAQEDGISRGRSPPLAGSHTLQDVPKSSVASLPADTSPNDGRDQTNSSKPLPFVRPADIYKRMEEERAKERSPADSSPPGEDATGDRDPPHISHLESDTQEGAEKTATSHLPEVQTGSSFGANFLTQSTETHTAPTSDSADAGKDDPDRADLHHNPSLGFRSVVHQAFDTPSSQEILQSPDSTADTVMRSNSDGTSMISPIISQNLRTGTTENRGPDETKTPTIDEDPHEFGAEAEVAGNQTPEFIPGHRRDFSTPSPGNSPARRAVVSTNDYLANPELADLSSISSSDASTRENAMTEVAEQEVASTSPDYTGTPKPVITTSSPMEPLRPLEMRGIVRHDHNPYAKTNDGLLTMSTEASPQDTESDRLRKEIVRSLSPQPEFDGEDTTTASDARSRIRQESTLIPSEYDSYWNDPSFHATADEGEAANSGIISASPADVSTKALPAVPDANTETSQTQSSLRRNFSWEDLGQANSPALGGAEGENRSNAQSGGPTANVATDQNSEFASPDGVGKDLSERDSLAVIPPHPEIQVSPESSNAGFPHPPENAGSLGTHQDVATINSGSHLSIEPVKSVHSATDPRVPGFREIMLLQTPNERIHMFNDAREQFAATDPGLENWLRITIQALPEHSELVGLQGHLQTNTSFHKPTPSRNKFPKLPSSFANLSLQTSLGQDNSPQTSTATHGRNPSVSGFGNVISGQHVQAKGKDILHSAGVLGGKAGGAAKGLFAKSRSRFKGSGNDKVLVPSSVSGYDQTHWSPASADTYPTQNGSTWPQRSYSLRRNLHLSSMSMGDTTASLPSIPASLDGSSDQTSLPLIRNNENGNSARGFAGGGHMNDARVTFPSNPVPEPNASAPRVSVTGTTLPSSEPVQNGYRVATSVGATSAAPPVLDIDIASPSIGERVFFALPEKAEGDPSPKYQVTEYNPERRQSIVSTTYSTAISLVNSHRTGLSDSSDETVSIPDEKHAANALEVHQNTINSDLPSYQTFEPPVEHTHQLRVENPPNHRRRFSFEDDDDEPALELRHPDPQQHVNDQMQPAEAEQRDEKRVVGGYPASPGLPPPAPPYSEPFYLASHTAPVASQHNQKFVQVPSQYTAVNPANRGYNQFDKDALLHNPHGEPPSTYPGANLQTNGYFPQHGPPHSTNSPYVSTYVEQQSSSAPIFPPYRTNSWVNTRPQHQAGTYPLTETAHSSYPSLGAAYPPHPQPHSGWTTTPQIRSNTAVARSGYLEANRTPGGSNRSGSFAKPDSDSQKSGESMTVNAAVSRTDLSQYDKAGAVAWKDSFSKEKKRNKLQRASTSRDPANSDNTMKKGLSRLSGIFGRSSTSASPWKAPFIPKLTSSSEQAEQQRLQMFNEPPGHPSQSTSTGAQTFTGEQPPIGGYYAPDSPLNEPHDEIDEIRSLQQSATSTGSNYGSYRPGQTGQGTSPTYRVSSTNLMRSNERQPRWDTNRSHTQNLHMRSRSPRAHPPRPQEYIDPTDGPNDPASNLGTFYSVVPATPRVGDQERPWNITLPDDGRRSVDQRPLSYIPEKLNNRARRQEQTRPPSVGKPSVNSPVEDFPPTPPPKDSDYAPAPFPKSETHTRGASRTRGRSLVVVPPAGEHRDDTPTRNVGDDCLAELPVNGDTSDEEVVMSSTAYPGQEWQPSNYGHWD